MLALPPSPAWPRPPKSRPGLDIAVCTTAFLVILFLTLPAFSGFFIGEDFIYYAFWTASGGNFLRAILTPLNSIFFRPASVAWNLFFQSMLPHDPLWHHARNYAMTCVLAVLVWMLIGRVVANRWARVGGFAFFVVSKVHLTDIGYININDSVMSTIHVVCLMLFLLIHLQTGARWSLWLSYVFFLLQAGSRDYGIVSLCPVLLTIAFDSYRDGVMQWRRLVRMGAPFVLLAVLFFTVRVSVLGHFPSGAGTAYALHLEAMPFLYRGYLFMGNILNLSLGAVQITGAGNYSDLLQRFAPSLFANTRAWNLMYFAAGWILLGGILLIGLRRDPRIIVPLSWVTLYMGPTFLIANIQIYYMAEAMAGLALALAMAFATLRGDRRWILAAVVGVLGVATVNAELQSRRVGMYSWRYCADATERAFAATILPNRGRQLEQWALLVADPAQRDFWSFNMTANGMSALVPVLMDAPGVTARVMPPGPATLATIPHPAQSAIYVVEQGAFVPLPASISATAGK